MKKKNLMKLLILFLTMMMALALPAEASAATKKVTAASEKRAKTIKTGKTTVVFSKTVGNSLDCVKFKASKSKTYKVNLSNVRVNGRKSSQDSVLTVAVASVGKMEDGKLVYVTVSGERIPLIFAGSTGFSKDYAQEVAELKKEYGIDLSALKIGRSKSFSVKLKKGQTLYLYFTNIEDKKLACDVTIK